MTSFERWTLPLRGAVAGDTRAAELTTVPMSQWHGKTGNAMCRFLCCFQVLTENLY